MARRNAETTTFRLTRDRDMDDNPATFAKRSETFAAAVNEKEHATLLVKKTEAGLEDYFISARPDERAVRELANAVGAKYERVEAPELNTDSVGHIVLMKDGATARETIAGYDPRDLSRQLVTLLDEPGSWVAITFRQATNTEKKRHRAWLEHRMGTKNPTHHTQGLTSVVIRVLAGTPEHETTEILLDQIARALPGFDLQTVAKTPTPVKESAPALVAATLFTAAAIAGFFTPAVAAFQIPFAALAILAGLIGLSRYRGWTLTRGHWLELAIANEHTWFATPPKWHGLHYVKPRDERTKGTKTISERDGDYPFASTTFCVGPTVITGLVAPQAGVASGERVVTREEVPPVFLHRVGPYIGDTDAGKVYLPADMTLYGTAIVGSPGSGKSRLIHGLYTWMMLEKRKPAGLRGFPGERNTLIAFESKGGGMPAYRRWAETIGEDLLVIDLNRPDSYAIDMLDVPGTFNERANFFVNAMIYAFGKESIQDRSFRTLVTAVAGGLCVIDGVADNIAEATLDPNSGPFYYAHTILGGQGHKAAVELMSAIIAKSNSYERALPDIRDALDRGAYDRVPDQKAQAQAFVAFAMSYIDAANGLRDLKDRSPSAFQNLTDAPANKVFQLLESAGRSWFSKNRPKISWKQILESHRSVIINTGASELGDAVPDRLSQQMSSMMLFTLKEAIARHCVEWNDAGRSVSLFSDELSLLAGHSSEVLQWVRDQGRSFGVRPFFATQRPEQLPNDVRSVFLNFANMISFVQDERATAMEIANAIETDGDWTHDMIQHLAPFSAAVRAQYDRKRQQAFTVKVADYEGPGGTLRGEFAERQGYTADEPTPAVPVVAEAPAVQAAPTPSPAPFEPISDDDYPDLSGL